jgi:hypothetical protein
MGWVRRGKALDAHETELKTYGPPPPNYFIERQESRGGQHRNHYMRYTELSVSSSASTNIYPLSPTGLKSNPTPIIHDEFDLDRATSPGVFDVPITYKAGTQIRWSHSSTWQGALTLALASYGFKCKSDKTKLVTEADVRATFKCITSKEAAEPKNSTLYYPADRKSMVFQDEPNVAMVARKYGCSLIIFCPFVGADKVGYNRIYNTKNRPPIYARWSTGQQAQVAPLVLGCLPKQKLKDAKSYEVMWFFIDVNQNDLPHWHVGFYTRHVTAILQL